MVQAAGGFSIALRDAEHIEGAAWSAEELNFIQLLFGEARDILGAVLNYSNPLPSLHSER